MKILLSAFACSPGRGSEPGVAWGFIQRAALQNEVWVITNIHNKPFIEAEMQKGKHSSVNYIYISPKLFMKLAYRSSLSHYLYYGAWQVEALRVARRLHHEVGFDIVHHLTYMNPWIPSLLGWVGPPFIWTAGNVERTPWSYIQRMPWRGKLQEVLRNLAVSFGMFVSGFLAARRAALILSASPPERWSKRLPVRHFPLGGLTEEDLKRIPRTETHNQQTPFRVVSIGRMLPWKGFDLGLQAFAKLQQKYPESEYWLIGEGPEKSRLEALARRLGVSYAVHFFGEVPRREVFSHLAKASVLLHPGLRESFGYVVVEALAAGVPVICLDQGALSRIVQEGIGIKIKAKSPEQVVEAMSEAMYALAIDPARRRAMGDIAFKYARRYWTWEAVGESLLEYYRMIDNRRQE